MSETATQDADHLRRALELAELGRGRVSPNPLVGAVLVAGGTPIGEGFHAELGGAHAEPAAIANARERGHEVAGSTMYVTLEPCAHHGRTPPCADALIGAGVARVVVASDDPSKRASGAGPERLRGAGIAVETAPAEIAREARLLNQPFRKHARTGRPHVVLKAAVSLDGRLATASGDSRWISGETSRLTVHRWRAEVDAVAIGIGTARDDDPLLTARDVGAARQPARVIFDSAATLDPDSAMVRDIETASVIVVAGSEAPSENVSRLRAVGVDVIEVPAGDGRPSIPAALEQLGARGITSILLEGGAKLGGAFADAGEIDEIRLFMAPLVIGGADAPVLLAGVGHGRIADAIRPTDLTTEPSGEDILIRARVMEW